MPKAYQERRGSETAAPTRYTPVPMGPTPAAQTAPRLRLAVDLVGLLAIVLVLLDYLRPALLLLPTHTAGGDTAGTRAGTWATRCSSTTSRCRSW
jgi:hypothetical protein